MPAPDVFQTILKTFIPNQSLHGEALERYYVQRPHAPLGPMNAYLRATMDQRVKVLFGGHRGSGKSTELLLENMSLLEYPNEHDWCDAHVAAQPLLSEGGGPA